MSDDKKMPSLQNGPEDAEDQEIFIEMKIPGRYYAWIQKLAETSGEQEGEVCLKLVQVALLDLEKRAHASTQQITKKPPIITKVGDLDQIRMTPRDKKIVH